MNDGIFIYQSKYAKNLVKKFGLETSKCLKTPMGTNDKLSKDDNDISIDPTLFRNMIRCLLYLTASRLDICFSVDVYARYQDNLKESHLAAVKRIINYVNSTTDYGILFPKDTDTSLIGLVM